MQFDNSSLSHFDNRESNTLVLDEGSASDINGSFRSLATTCMSLNNAHVQLDPHLLIKIPLSLNIIYL